MSELPAGSELDRLVAEKVMGWRLVEEDQESDDSSFDWWTNGGDPSTIKRYAYTEVGASYHKIPLWNPSESIVHAWEVVEHLRTIGHHLAMNDTGCQWRLRFLTVQGPRVWDWAANPNDGMTVWNESLPLAICRAALKAVEGT